MNQKSSVSLNARVSLHYLPQLLLVIISTIILFMGEAVGLLTLTIFGLWLGIAINNYEENRSFENMLDDICRGKTK